MILDLHQVTHYHRSRKSRYSYFTLYVITAKRPHSSWSAAIVTVERMFSAMVAV